MKVEKKGRTGEGGRNEEGGNRSLLVAHRLPEVVASRRAAECGDLPAQHKRASAGSGGSTPRQ
ncbi:hypothetical protein CGRA01v4_06375 [Colletotrichum graminicola]|nr:hypothetical protein CGRA01v4_06375 [Colletotrichum graminicola]